MGEWGCLLRMPSPLPNRITGNTMKKTGSLNSEKSTRRADLSGTMDRKPEADTQRLLLQQLRTWVEERQPQMLRMLSELVHIESPSSEKATVDRAVELVAGWSEAL